MSAVEEAAGHLLAHAVAMGGWLAADYCRGGDYDAASDALAEAGLWVFTTGGGPDRMVLTDAGWAAAQKVAG